jgi:hypothetical protein
LEESVNPLTILFLGFPPVEAGLLLLLATAECVFLNSSNSLVFYLIQSLKPACMLCLKVCGLWILTAVLATRPTTLELPWVNRRRLLDLLVTGRLFSWLSRGLVKKCMSSG